MCDGLSIKRERRKIGIRYRECKIVLRNRNRDRHSRVILERKFAGMIE